MAGLDMKHTEWDVVVVGAGIIGCAVARDLARRGAHTLVLEAREVGAGATQASAGVLAPFIEAPGEGPLQSLTVQSLALYDEFVSSASVESETRVEYRRCGTLEVAHDSASADRLRTLGDWVASRGVEATWIDSAGISQMEPSLSPTHGGLLVSSHGYVRASQLTHALATAARRHGAAVRTGARVDDISFAADRATVMTGGEVHGAKTVVVTGGSWSGQLSPEADVIPVRGQLLQVKWQGPLLQRILWTDRCYLVPWLDGTLLIGATVEDAGFDERVTAGGMQELLNAAIAVLPGLANATFVDARVGLRPATRDGLPIIRRSRVNPALVLATGHFRNGILLAPLTARLVADLVS
jgi:glycine oxidase